MFNVGDAVICINAHHPLIVGQEYIVASVTPHSVWVEGVLSGWKHGRFVEKTMDIEIEEKPVKPTIVLNAKAKPKEQPKPKKEKGQYLSVEQFVGSHLYKNFLKYEDGNKVVDAYNAIKHVYAGMEFEHQRTYLLKANDINGALTWADWEIDGWDWAKSFQRCTKNKKKALAEAKKAKQEEQAI